MVAAVFTPDGQRIVSCDRTGAVVFWDVASTRECARFSLKNGTIQSLAISPDGATLAVAGKQAVIWRIAKGQEQLRLDAEFGQVNGIAFSHDGKHLATGAMRGGVRMWETRGWKLEASFTGHQVDVESVAFAPDDRTLASVDGLGIVHLWDRVTRAKDTIASGHERLWCVAFSPDGRSLATSSKDATVNLWDVDRDRVRIPVTLPTSANPSIAFSADGKTLTVADDRGSIWTVSPITGHLIAAKRFEAGEPGRHAALSRDGSSLATSGDTGIITLWNLASGRRIRDFPDKAPPNSNLAIAPDGEWIARCGDTPSIWSAAGSQSCIEGANGGWLLFAPRGDTLSIWSWDSTEPRLYDLSSGKLRTAQGDAHRNYITAQAYSHDGATLASAGVEGSIVLWDVATLDRLVQFYGHTAEVRSLAFLPDGRTLASGTQDGLLMLWDLASVTELATFEGHTGPVRQVCYTEDGLTLATRATRQEEAARCFSGGRRRGSRAGRRQENRLHHWRSGKSSVCAIEFPISCIFSFEGVSHLDSEAAKRTDIALPVLIVRTTWDRSRGSRAPPPRAER